MMNLKKHLLVAVFTVCGLPVFAQMLPHKNPNLPSAVRAKDLVLAFEFFDPKDAVVKVTPGEYELLYGESSDSKDLKTIKIKII
jgi:hypothetical protein